MAHSAFLENISTWGKILLLFGLILLFTLFSAFLGLLIGKFYLNVDMAMLGNYIADPKTPEAVNFIKFFQVINQIGTFILPVLFFSYLVSNKPAAYLKMDRKPRTLYLSISFLLIFMVLPFINYLESINQDLRLPDMLAGIETWIREKEVAAARLTEIIIKTNSISGFIVNLVLVALLPAFGEELSLPELPLKPVGLDEFKGHMIMGVIVVLFAVVRMILLAKHSELEPLEMSSARESMVKWNHRLIYVMIFATGLSGVATAKLSNLGDVVMLGGDSSLYAGSDAIVSSVASVHTVSVSILALLIAMHIVGVLSYRFKSNRPIFSRMWF